MTRPDKLLLGLGVALVLASRIYAFHLMPYPSEDALIAFRVARNLAAGLGPYYNPGEYVGSVTSLPWTFALAAGYLLNLPYIAWARGLSLICDAVTLWAAWKILKERAWIFAVAFSLPIFSAATASGLETPAVVAALVASCRWPVHGVLAALRPEGLVAAAVLAKDRRSWVSLCVGAAISLGAAVVLYGHLFPTALAKAEVYGVHWFGGAWWLAPLMPWAIGCPVGMIQALNCLGLFATIGLVYGIGRKTLRLALVSVGALIAYAVAGTAGFWWYAVPWLAGVALVCAQGMPNIVRRPVVAGVFAAVFLLLGWRGWAKVNAYGLSEEPMMQAANYLSGSKGSIFLEPAGFIGFSAPEMRVIDEVGLITPWVAHRRATGGPGWWSDAMRKYKPDYILVRSNFLLNGQAFAGAGDAFRDEADAKTTGSYIAKQQFGNLVLLKRSVP